MITTSQVGWPSIAIVATVGLVVVQSSKRVLVIVLASVASRMIELAAVSKLAPALLIKLADAGLLNSAEHDDERS